MKVFDTNEVVAGMAPCQKLPVVIHAKQMSSEFRVISLEGDYKQGKPGDYLMQGVRGELYICDCEIFEETYRWVSPAQPAETTKYIAGHALGDESKETK